MKTPEELADEHTTAWWDTREDSIMTIATRQSFVAGYQAAAPQWISVKDKMPETNEYVLVYIDFSIDTQQFKLVEMGYFNGDAWDVGNDIYSLGFVRYWMPIPKPPEE